MFKQKEIRKHLIFSGRVQGVGFRYRAMNIAQMLGLTGWVKNRWDGKVEMEVQGKREEIGKMISMLYQQKSLWKRKAAFLFTERGEKKVMTEEEWLKQLFAGLSKSSFRSRFHLKEQDKEYVRQKGLDKIQEHAQDFIEKRLAPAVIPNDGKQTPMRGHPVFIAQHATARKNGIRSGQGRNLPPGRKSILYM